jgi:hypothetical protein
VSCKGLDGEKKEGGLDKKKSPSFLDYSNIDRIFVL